MSKKNENKYKPSLVYTSLLKEVSSIREYGIKKHGSAEDWLTTNPKDHLDAAIRHIRAASEGEQIDKDSGRLHLTCAAANIMFEIERFYRNSNPPKKKSSEMLTLGQYLMGGSK